MASNRFDAALELDIGYSRQLQAYLLAIHLLAIIALLFPLALAGWFRLVLCCACLVSYWWFSRDLLLKSMVTAVAWHSRDDWSIRLAGGKWIEVEPVGEQLVLSWLVIVQFVDETGARYPVMILSDMTLENRFRHLRVRLLGEAAQDPAGSRL